MQKILISCLIQLSPLACNWDIIIVLMACISLSITQPKLILLNNYPEEWQQRYAQHRYIVIDPTVRHCLSSLNHLLV